MDPRKRSEEAGREEVVSSRPAGGGTLEVIWKLLELLGWIQEKLEKIRESTEDEYLRSSLHTVIRAADPVTNPKLRRIFEVLDHPAHTEKR